MSRKIIIFLWRQIEIANLQKYVGRNQSPRVAFLQSYKFHKRSLLHLSVGTVITKEIKEPDNRVLPGALLIGCIVSFVVRSLCLGSLRSKRFCVISEQRYPGFQRLFQRGFRFLSSLYSDPRFSRGFGLRPKMCRPSANTEDSHHTREKPLVPRVEQRKTEEERNVTPSTPSQTAWL